MTVFDTKVKGVPTVAYVSDLSPMLVYVNAHVAVDQIRHRNQQMGKIGPKVSPVVLSALTKATIR